jgi:hypothetical protein
MKWLYPPLFPLWCSEILVHGYPDYMYMGAPYCNGPCTLALLRINIIYIAQTTLTEMFAIEVIMFVNYKL